MSRPYLTSACVIVVLAGFGCSRKSDATQATGMTNRTLTYWSEILTDAFKYDQDMPKGVEITAVLDELKSNGFVDDLYSHLQYDYWHREFVWGYTEVEQEKTVRVISKGRNGVYENGDGDDLYVEIKFIRGKKPVVRYGR